MSRTNLDAVYRKLSVEHRARLIVEALMDGREEDPLIRSSMPPLQSSPLDELLGYAFRVLITCPPRVQALGRLIDMLEAERLFMVTVQDWAAERAPLLSHAVACRTTAVDAGWLLSRVVAGPDPDVLTALMDEGDATTDRSAQGMAARELVESLRPSLLGAWNELIVLEDAARQVGERFASAMLAARMFGDALDRHREDLVALHEALGALVGKVDVPTVDIASGGSLRAILAAPADGSDSRRLRSWSD